MNLFKKVKSTNKYTLNIFNGNRAQYTKNIEFPSRIMTDCFFMCQFLANWYYKSTFVGGIVLNNLSTSSFNESSNNTFGIRVSTIFRSMTKLVNM